jgi:hypothetical protein
VDLDPLWDAVPLDRLGLMRNGPYGIRCPACGKELRVLQTRVAVAIATLFFGPFFLAIFLILSYVPYVRDDALRLISMGVVVVTVVWLQGKYAKRFARLRELNTGEVVGFPLDVEVPDIYAVPIDGPQPFRATSEDNGLVTPWTCSSCGETNPGEFEICWKCAKERP